MRQKKKKLDSTREIGNKKSKRKILQDILQGQKRGVYEGYIKRPMDFVCALLALIFLSPVMLITMILVR